jgi:hypothetical protein
LSVGAQRRNGFFNVSVMFELIADGDHDRRERACRARFTL